MSKNTINTIIGILIIFGILVGYSLLTKPSKEELALRQKKQDSMLLAQKEKLRNDSLALLQAKSDSIKQDSVKKIEVAADTVKKTDTAANITPQPDGLFSCAAGGQQKYYQLENEFYIIRISAMGGGISSVELKNYKTWDQQPLYIFKSDTSNYSLTFFAENRDVNTANLYFEPHWYTKAPDKENYPSVSGSDSLVLGMRLYPNLNDSIKDTSKYIEYLYVVKGDNYMTGFTINLVNMQQAIQNNNTYLAFDWMLNMRQQEKSLENEKNNTSVYFKPAEDKVDYLKETKDDKKEKLPNLKWISLKQQFFAATLISGSSFTSATLENTDKSPKTADTTSERYLKTLSAQITLPYNVAETSSYPMQFYFGPTKYNVLRKYDLDLERQIPLGWSFFLLQWINRYAVIPVFDFLSGFGWNYGIIILILTILLKIVLLPIAYKTYMSSAKMRVLKPEVDEIAKKFPKKEDALKKQQATMALYKKAGANPMSGCIPMLLQMPILIAMYRFFPASIELRQQKFLWATDLSTYDSIWTFPNGFSIPFYGDHVSLFTLLMTISTVIYTHLNNKMMTTTSQPGMKFVMYAMPIMFLGFFNNFAAGLSYYYFLANIITFLQMFLFQKFVDHDKILAKIQENKKKPVKVSGFQKRLEAMAKQRGYKK